MDLSVARQLAEAADLSPLLQRHLWEIGDFWVRRNLARRTDLIREIAELVCEDDALIASWAAVQRSDMDLLGVAADRATGDQTIMMLLNQTVLPPGTVEKLVAKASTAVGWHALGKHELSESVAHSVLRNYVREHPPMSDAPGRIFEEYLGENVTYWRILAEEVGLATLPFLRAAAVRTFKNEELREAVVAALERLEHSGAVPESRASRHLHSVVDDILRSPYVTADHLRRMSVLGILSSQHAAIARRENLDLAAHIRSFDCYSEGGTPASSRHVREHVSSLQLLASLPGFMLLPAEEIAYEALQHRLDLSDSELASLLTHTRGLSSRRIAANLERLGKLDELVVMAELLGVLVLDQVRDVQPVLLALARRGSRDINDRTVPTNLQLEVVANYQPLNKLLGEHELCAVILQQIELLSSPASDTALQLLGEWVGTLPELLAAAEELS